MLKYVIKDINDISPEEYTKSYSNMSESRRAKVDRLKNEIHKKCTLAGELLAKQLLSEISGKSFESLTFYADKYGKLHSETTPDLHFNISHSRNMVAVAICHNPVGIDIEVFHPVSARLSRKFCSFDELCYIFGKTPTDEDFEKDLCPQSLIKFFEIWTIKEACFKCIGTGITEFSKVNALSLDFNKTRIETYDYILHIITSE